MKLTQNKVNKLFLKAVKAGDLEGVKYLLNDSPIKANLHLTNEVEDPEYCLMVATEFNQLPVLKYLLEETDLKKYTKMKGRLDYVHSYVYDTIHIMYEQAAQTGNIELIEYIMEKLPIEDKLMILTNAAYENHVHVLDYMIKNDLLSQQDKVSLGHIRNAPMENSLKYHAKESVEYLLNYYETTPYKHIFNSIEFKTKAMLDILARHKKLGDNFEIFNIFFNDPQIQKNQEELFKTKIFEKIAELKNFNLYTEKIKTIKDKDLKKKIILQSYYFAVENDGKLEDYPLFTYLIKTYKSYLDKTEKLKIFYQLIYSNNNEERFNELLEYDFLLKGTDFNQILKVAVDNIRSEGTFNLITQILNSKVKNKINIHYGQNFFFRKIVDELDGYSEKTIDILRTILENYPETKIEKIEYLFEEDKNIVNFITKWKLNDKLSKKLPEKTSITKKLKI